MARRGSRVGILAAGTHRPDLVRSAAWPPDLDGQDLVEAVTGCAGTSVRAATSQDFIKDDLREATDVADVMNNRPESAGRIGIVLPALLARFCGGAGVGSGAWVRPDLRIG
jgi:hypothetical protein